MKSALNGSLNSAESNKLNKNLSQSTQSIGKLFKFGVAWGGLKKVYSSLIEPSISLIESTNLFEVQMGKVVDEYGNLDSAASQYYTKALAFQEKMNEKLATNMEETMQYQAKYFAMFKNQGIDLDSSYFMSENLTEAGYDIASLYNLTTEEAMDKLRAGLAGQVEPLRAIGIDISESALKKIVEEAGIERSVQQLSYAEKEVARYIAIVEQAGAAQGDFAKTFESPANQVKVFKNQLQELKQVAGSFITGVFGNIIVYANAVIMTIKEILKSLASLFGIELNYTNSFASTNDSLGEIEDSIGGATSKAKEFKKQLMGFDEIHNITLPDNSSSGSGSASAGIDDRLLQSLKDWDNQMDSISGKAQEIKDKMLDWLGFTKDVNGNLKWSWNNLDGIAKTIAIILGAFVGISLIGKIIKITQSLKNLFKIVKGGKAGITAFQVGLSAIGKVSKNLIAGFKNLAAGTKLGIEQFKIFRNAGDGVVTSLSKTSSGLLELIPNFVKVGGGILGLGISITSAYGSMKDFANETIGAGEALLKMTGSIAGATASGALIGSVFGPAGTAIGAVAGAATSAVTGLVAYTTTLDESTQKVSDNIEQLGTKLKEIKDNYAETTSEINANRDASLLELETVSILSKELEELVDVNGRVKDGYEERVSTILGELNNALGTEYTLTGNQIAINGDLIDSYGELSQSIDNYIEKQEQRIIAEAYEEEYKELLKKRIELEDALEESLNNVYAAQEDLNSSYGGLSKNASAAEKAQHKYNQMVAQGNLREAIEQHEKLQQELNDTNKELQEAKDGYSDAYKSMLDTTEIQGKEIETETKTIFDTVLNITETKGTEIVNTTGITLQKIPDEVFKWSTDIEDSYEDVASDSVTAYSDGLDDLKTETENSMNNIPSTIRIKAPEAVAAAQGAARDIKNGIGNIDTTGVGKQVVDGVATGINNNKSSNKMLSAITGLKNFVTDKIKGLFGIHSPSKVMADIAQYIPAGMAQGIEENTDVVFSSIKKLSDGIKVNSEDMTLGINQYVDYGQITGEIKAKSNVNVGANIIQGIAQSVKEALQNTSVNVEIEAKTEEGVMVKKVSQGFKDYVTQTGELPFPIPV